MKITEILQMPNLENLTDAELEELLKPHIPQARRVHMAKTKDMLEQVQRLLDLKISTTPPPQQ